MDYTRENLNHLERAEDYIDLGMLREANAELEELTPEMRASPIVWSKRIRIYRGLKKWDLMASVAAALAEWDPKDPAHVLNMAFATRDAGSIECARAIPLCAAELHPQDGTVQFNLASYERNRGRLEEAKAHLRRATAIDARFRLMALDDPDFASLGLVRRCGLRCPGECGYKRGPGAAADRRDLFEARVRLEFIPGRSSRANSTGTVRQRLHRFLAKRPPPVAQVRLELLLTEESWDA